MIKSKPRVFLGVDTSCYTTSVALLDEQGVQVRMARRLLTVPVGGRGLRQSEMVFAHTKNLPELINDLDFSDVQVAAIGVSARPRAQEDSYMPAFLVGLGWARSLATVLQVPIVELSHQDNHLHAGIWSSQMPACPNFLFVHISGGTTEVIKVEGNKSCILCGTKDISAGQFIDRIGVKLGLGFPAGPHMERLAQSGHRAIELPIAVQKGVISFSGPCSAAERLLSGKQIEAADMAQAVQECIAISLFRSIRYFAKDTKVRTLLIVGGVASNSFIREYLQLQLGKLQIDTYFAQPEYSADNALGCAVMARNAYNAGKNLFDK